MAEAAKLRNVATTYDFSPLHGALSNLECQPSNLDFLYSLFGEETSCTALIDVKEQNKGIAIENKNDNERPIKLGQIRTLSFLSGHPRIIVFVAYHNIIKTDNGAFLFSPKRLTLVTPGGLGPSRDTNIQQFRKMLGNWEKNDQVCWKDIRG